jgi:hypothetical protein
METKNNNNSGMDQPAVEPRRSGAGKLWVVVVLLLGLIAGILVSDLATMPEGDRPNPFRNPGIPVFNPDPSIRLHIVLTTVEVAMLVALVGVYIKIYSETRANFALALTVVLGALFLQTVFSYPLILGTEGVILVPGTLTWVSDFLTLGAYTIFLYLSLE